MPFPSVSSGQWVQVGASVQASVGVLWLPDGAQTATQLLGGNNGWPVLPNEYGGPYYDTDHDELIYDAVGGHGDYPGNEVYRLSTVTQVWDRVFDGTSHGVNNVIIPSNTGGGPFFDSYTDGGGLFGPAGRLYPASTHRYHGSCYMRLRGLGFHAGGNVWGPGTPSAEIWTLNTRAGSLGAAWARLSNTLSSNNSTSVCYDAQADVVYLWNRLRLASVNPTTGAISPLTNNGAGTSSLANHDTTILFDPKRRRVVMLSPTGSDGTGGPTVAYVNLFLSGTLSWTTLATSGATECLAVGSYNPIYDEVRDRYVVYNAAIGQPGSLYFINPDSGVITREDGTGTLPPAGNLTNGTYGNFFRSVINDAYGLVTSFTDVPFYYRPATQTRTFTLASQAWTGQPLPPNVGTAASATKLRVGRDSKHMHAFSDEGRGVIVIGGGDSATPAPGDADPQTDTYDPRTQTYSVLVARCNTTSGLMVNRPDNVAFGHDTDHDLYLMGLGFYAALQGGTIDNGPNGIGCTSGMAPTNYHNNISVLNPTLRQWSDGAPYLAGFVPQDSHSGQWDYDPPSSRFYQLTSGGMIWYNTTSQTWGQVSLPTITGQTFRERVCVDVYGRKAYFIDLTTGKLAYMSINLLDGSFGQHGYVPNPDIPGYPLPFNRTDLNQPVSFDPVNRVILCALLSREGGFGGAILRAPYYSIDAQTWSDVPLTSADFPGGEAQGTFVCGNNMVYDKAHNTFVLYGGNGGGTFPATGNQIPFPTKFALVRIWGGPGAAVPISLAPTITALAPSSALVGSGGFTLTVTGTLFTADAVVQWDSAPRTTFFDSATQLRATILGADVTMPGTVAVTVTETAGVSTSRAFSVLYPPTTLGLVYEGQIRDRVGQGDGALAPDGAMDGTVAVTLFGTGGRVITAIRMRPNAIDEWNTTVGDGKWLLGVALSRDGTLLNNPVTMAVGFTVADSQSFWLFGSDASTPTFFVLGTTLTVIVTMADGSTATQAVTIGSAGTVFVRTAGPETLALTDGPLTRVVLPPTSKPTVEIDLTQPPGLHASIRRVS